MKLNEVYAKSGLGKWFKKESATKEPGWDRYNTAGKRVGKCGDAKEGQPYSACLSAQKARKLGKEGIGNFVKRKRAAQSKAGRGKKGTGAKGKKPINVETGAAKRKVNEEMKFVKENWANDILKSVWGMTDEQIDADKAKIQQQARAAMSPEELKAYDARDAEANKIMTDTAQRLRNLTAQSQDLRASMEANQQRLRDTTERNMGLKQESNAQREAALKDIKSGNYKPYAEYQGSSPTRPGKYLPVVRSQAEKEAALQALDTKPTTSTPPKQWKTAADVVGGLMGMLNTPTAVTEAADCGCEHSEDKKIADKLIGKLKKKQIKENAPVHHFTPETIKEYTDFTELTLSPFKGKKALIETVDGDWYGVLGVFKNNYALFEGETVKKVIEPTEVIKVICEGTKILILEKNKPNDPDKWSSCKSAAKSKFDVYPSAYANAWAAKCYKKKGGTWRSVKEETDITAELLNEVIKHKDGKWVVMNKDETKVLGTHESKTKALAQLRAIEANKARHGVHEGVDLVLKDTLKDLFFSEEVVNKDHKGTMTAAEKKKRDEIAAEMHKRGNIKRIKTDERLDSQEEAEFRTATFKVLAMRKGKGKGKKSKK